METKTVVCGKCGRYIKEKFIGRCQIILDGKKYDLCCECAVVRLSELEEWIDDILANREQKK